MVYFGNEYWRTSSVSTKGKGIDPGLRGGVGVVSWTTLPGYSWRHPNSITHRAKETLFMRERLA